MHTNHDDNTIELLQNFEAWAIFEINLTHFLIVIEALGIKINQRCDRVAEDSVENLEYCHLNLGFKNQSPCIEEGNIYLEEAISNKTAFLRVFISGELERALELDLLSPEKIIQFRENIKRLESEED